MNKLTLVVGSHSKNLFDGCKLMADGDTGEFNPIGTKQIVTSINCERYRMMAKYDCVAKELCSYTIVVQTNHILPLRALFLILMPIP